MKIRAGLEEKRGDVLENLHKVALCIVDDKGNVIHSTGNEERITFLRSASKPIQALPVLLRGLDKKYNLDGSEIAIMAGSHRGEPFHIEILQRLLNKAEIDEHSLICPKAYPINENEKVKKDAE